MATKIGFRITRDLIVGLAAVTLLGLAAYALVVFRPPSVRNRRAIAWVKAEHPLQRRAARSLVWDELGDEDDVFPGDVVRVPPVTKAHAIIGDKRSIPLPPGATLRFFDVGGGLVEALPIDSSPVNLRVYPRVDNAPADPADLERRLAHLTGRLAKAGSAPILPVKPMAGVKADQPVRRLKGRKPARGGR